MTIRRRPKASRASKKHQTVKAAFKRLRARAIIAMLLGCALRRSEVAALTDGRCSGGFTPEATGVAARHANTAELFGEVTDE